MVKYFREFFKVSFEKEKYDVDDEKKVVVCRVKWDLLGPGGHPVLSNGSTGTATCAEEDVYNREIGKKIAFAKAQNKAYQKAFEFVSKGRSQLLDLSQFYADFIADANRIMKKNNDYIKRVQQSTTTSND